MALDECVEYPSSVETVKRATKLTGRWARRAKEFYLAQAGHGLEGAPSALFGIVQGGTDAALRRESAEEIVELGFEGYAIGGLSVGEPKEKTYEVAELTAGLLPEDQPRYLMGLGTPEDLVECVPRRHDAVEQVNPARNGCA